ncbi:hypothetical protein LTR56_006456 [Elasticomyces elasticus]|nr:hypothetical protein LTR22_012970 [Elasticomyces elasticus]KAK3650181.1 hypothetical protein LTR56_006456 [Elasticomyces elasticus]KAK4927044.1 hypothetical protein LTR49_006201 [Elasticomyces elasticus]KAK5716080.1 hypothetical protein LTR15_009905 [Elasticomyces elasticus]
MADPSDPLVIEASKNEPAHSIMSATIEKGSTVLVTGVNGFIASHVADQLLQAGYKVRGTVRSLSKADYLYKIFDPKFGEGKFEAVTVPDMVGDAAFDDAVRGVSGIVHLASVVTFSDKFDEVVPPTVKGALNVLTSASKESGVKSVVYTSSSTAALTPEPNKKIVITSDSWNDAAVNAARNDPNVDPYSVYAASKTEGERAIWKAVEQTKPPFQVAAVLPNANFGAVLQPGGEMSASTGAWPAQLFTGKTGILNPMDLPPQWFVDVQDDARLHVAALIDPSCNGKRIFAFAKPYTCNEILAIFRKAYPDRKFMEDRDMGEDLSTVPSEEAEALLKKHYGKGWTSLEESVMAGVANLA